jgi:hypothetical protein
MKEALNKYYLKFKSLESDGRYKGCLGVPFIFLPKHIGLDMNVLSSFGSSI